MLKNLMLDLTNLERFYNRAESSEQVDYKVLLFRAQEVFQSSEMVELQDYMNNSIKHLTEVRFKSGDIISGGEVLSSTSDNTTTGTDSSFRISESVIYYAGYFVRLPEKIINQSLDSIGTNILGIKILEEVVNDSDDPNLKSQAVGALGFNTTGAYRVKISGEWLLKTDYSPTSTTSSIGNSTAAVYDKAKSAFIDVFSITEGTIKRHQVLGIDFYKAKDLIESYDRKSNGNYVIEGLEVTSSRSSSYKGPYTIDVGQGECNVLGENFVLNNTTELVLEELSNFELINSHPIQYSVVGEYLTSHEPIEEITRISGTMITTDNITKGIAGGTDELSSQPVLQIITVVSGATTYVDGTDYTQQGDYIKWLAGGTEPADGDTVVITYHYRLTEVLGGFTALDGGTINGTLSNNRSSFHLGGFVPNTVVDIDYKFLLKRMDSVVINSEGELEIVLGSYDEDSPKAPAIPVDGDKLVLANVIVIGDGETIVQNVGTRTFKMSDIELLLSNLKQLEYNVSKLSLMNNLKMKNPTASLKNTFIEDFEDDTNRDAGLTQDALTIGGNLILNTEWTTIPVEFNESLGEYITLSIAASSVVLDQPRYSESKQINKYVYKKPPEVKVLINPIKYSWTSKHTYTQFLRSLRARTRVNTTTTGRVVSSVNRTIDRRFGWWGWSGTNVSRSTSTSLIGSSISSRTTRELVSNTSKSVSSYSIIKSQVKVPPRDFRISSPPSSFNAGELVKISVGGIEVSQVTAAANGALDPITLTTPVGLISGDKLVEVVGLTSDASGDTTITNTPLEHRVATTKTTIWRRVTHRFRRLLFRRTTTTTLTSRWRRIRSRDPLAQTFKLDDSCFINSVVYNFAVLPTTEVVVFLSETIVGIPDSQKALTFLSIDPADITLGENTFTFDHHVKLEADKEYALIILSDDSVGEVQVARLGDMDNDGAWITKNPYTRGVLLESSNNTTWTPNQDMDLCFRLSKCVFNNTSSYTSNPLTVTNATDLILHYDDEILKDTKIEYFINLVDRGSNNRFRITSDKQIMIGDSYTGAVTIETIMTTTNTDITPVLEREMTLSVGVSSTFSNYISKSITIDNVINILMNLDMFQPTNTTIRIYYENEADVWVEIPKIASESVGNDWVEAKFFFDGVSNTQDSTRIKIELNTSNISSRPVIANLRTNFEVI